MAIVFNNLSGGSGGKLYEHNIRLNQSNGYVFVTLNLKSDIPLTNVEEFKTVLFELGFTSENNAKECSGVLPPTATTLVSMYVTESANSKFLYFRGMNFDSTTTTVSEQSIRHMVNNNGWYNNALKMSGLTDTVREL